MTKLFEELNEGMKQAIDVAEGKMPGRITVSKGLIKYDLCRMTDQELQQLIENAVSELYDRQKEKHAAIYQEAEAALQKNEKDCYSKLCGQMGRVQATEDILKEFLGRF